MNRALPFLFAFATLASTLLACSSDETAPHPVPVDAATDAAPAADGAPKGEAGSEASIDGGVHDAGGGSG